MVGLAIVAEPLTVLLFSDKWLPSVPILQLLCIAGPAYPLSVILVSTILAKGKSGLFLKLDIYKKTFGLSAMLVGLYFGFYPFLIAIIISTLIGLFFNFLFTAKMLKLNLLLYLQAMYPSIVLSFIMACLCLLLESVLPVNYILQLISISVFGIVIYLSLSHLFKLNDYLYLKNLAKEKLIKKPKQNYEHKTD
jgi:O-antigen/teichoic acid export membrane protein